jgi:hypothetical protein
MSAARVLMRGYETHRVPSVGIDPPTPTPSPNSDAQSSEKLGATAAQSPKTEVSNRVNLKGFFRPFESE